MRKQSQPLAYGLVKVGVANRPSCFSGKIRGFTSFNMIRRTESRKSRQMAYPAGINHSAGLHRQNMAKVCALRVEA